MVGHSKNSSDPSKKRLAGGLVYQNVIKKQTYSKSGAHDVD
jgi:hypothetical protein